MVLDMASVGSPAVDIEDALWRAVAEGLAYDHQVTVVIDGLDHVSGGERSALKVMERLRSITSSNTTVKSIVLSTPIGQTAIPEVKQFSIEPRLVQGDIRLFVKSLIQQSPHMDRLTVDEQLKVVEQVSAPAEGSFIWAKVTFATITKQNTVSAILKSLETTARGLDRTLEKLVFSLDLQNQDTRSLLAWMLASERPMHLNEIKAFLELSPSDETHAPRFSNIENDVQNAIGDIITVQDGYVRFVHTSVRSYLLKLAESVTDLSNTGKWPFSMAEAHFDVATRSVAYLKLFLTRSMEPTSTPVTSETVTDVFRDSPLLEYCVRYWNVHVERSPVYQQDGKHKLVPTFKKNFPGSILLAVLEGPTWENQFSSSRLLQMHTVALSLRISVLGNEDPAVLQTKLNLASMYRKLDERTKASDNFYEAYELSLKLFGERNKVTIGCATGVLESRHSVKITTRNSASTRLENILTFIISANQTSEDTIKYSTMLAELYTNIGESDKAIKLWRTVYETSAETFGSFDTQTTKVYEILLNSLKQLNRYNELAVVMRFAYDRARKSLSVSDSRRHELAIDLIQLYESQKDSSASEEILVDEWRSLTTAATSTGQTDWHSEKLALSVQYAQFLRKHQRNSEAQNILLGTWSEYKERSDIRSETVMNTFVAMAQEMKQLEMTETAHSLLLSMWNETKVSNRETSLTEIISTELLQTTEQMVRTKKDIVDSDMSIEEKIIEDIAHTANTSSSTSTSTSAGSTKTQRRDTSGTSFSSTDSLSMFYYGQERWVDAIRVCTNFLQKAWPSVLVTTTTEKLSLPSKQQKEVILVATRLAECHFNSGNTVDSEQLLQNVFTAVTRSLTYTDESVTSISTTLIKFLESTHQFVKALHVHEVLYNLIKEKAGPTSEPAIHAAYQCARFCIEHGLRKDAERFYLDVYLILSAKSDVLPEDALEAAKWLEEHYKRETRWKDARPIYPKIWQTIVTHGKKYGFTAEYISRFYSTYIVALKTHYDASYDQVRQVSLQFRDLSVTLFGQEDESTLKAMYELARIDEQSDKHREEAVQLYKSIMSVVQKKQTSTALSSQLLTVIRETKKQVAQLYSSSTSTSKEAVSIIHEEYRTNAFQLGYSHKSTLDQQHQLLIALAKADNKESRTRMLEILETSVTNIVSNEKDSNKLFESAQQIAKSYIETKNTEVATTLLSKLRRQLIFEEHTKDLKIKVNRTDRSSFAFIAAFELALNPQRQFSEIMSELMTESMRYEAYHKSVTEKTSIVTILQRGSQLLEYLERMQRKAEFVYIRTDMLKTFKSHLGVSTQESQLQAFFEIVISHIAQTQDKSTVLQIVVQRVLDHMNESRFVEAYELALLESKFMKLSSELSTLQNVRYGFSLALYLSGRGTKRCGDVDLSVKMLNLSRTIIIQVLASAREQKIQFSSMSLEEVNMLAGLLGQLEMFSELEIILAEVWTSRHIQQTWTSSTVVTLGRRLVEVRFAAGRTESAIHICGDIIYNLRRVWGELDTTTLSFWNLLAELHNVSGNFHATQNVHEEVLRQTLTAVEDGDVTSEKGASVAATHMDFLRIAYQRGSGWSRDSKIYSELQAQLRAEFGKENAWTQGAASKQDIEKWSKSAPKGDAGMWKRPTSWEFVIADESGGHRNNLRKISGLFASSSVSGGSPRGDKSYGQELSGRKRSVY